MKNLLHHDWRALSVTVGTRYRVICRYANQCLSSGFMPHTVRSIQYIGKILARIWMFIQVGRVKVIGRENIPTESRIIFCANHSSMFDPILLYVALNRFPRFMTAVEEMRGIRGLKAIIMGAIGSFAVDRSKGKTAIQPAVDVLSAGEALVIFPEAKISPTGEFLPFKLGLSLIAVGAYEKLERREKIGFVPIRFTYHGRHIETAKGPYLAMGLKWRKGATVTIGTPIWLHDFASLDPGLITETVRTAIVEMPGHIGRNL
ncbi:MAG: 1-acyl-sn-glycerol-3-phosphate acyltransferase [Cyanobacteria bacterium SZAS LIN-2]|nr:1-acyl-sn-glycerol-3-phosphate acyltransferase [Cyanobacteria bacterium SZAS LIN-3]MBS1997283.1 1-acyl-sn-glycerol-3-phosphate acyltransferase [Cyanobacteria bacterium SZAS LIN-2]